MIIVRKEDKLIIQNKDFLYGIIFLGVVITVGIIGFGTEQSNNILGLIVGLTLIIIALWTRVTNIVIDYKKKELYTINGAIIPIFQTTQTFAVKNIKKISSEIESKEIFNYHRYRIILTDKSGTTHILVRAASGTSEHILAKKGVSIAYKNVERVAKALDDKVKELKK